MVERGRMRGGGGSPSGESGLQGPISGPAGVKGMERKADCVVAAPIHWLTLHGLVVSSLSFRVM